MHSCLGTQEGRGTHSWGLTGQSLEALRLRSVGCSHKGATAVGLGCRLPQIPGPWRQGLVGWDGGDLVSSKIDLTNGKSHY